MNGLYLQPEGLEEIESWVEMNVLCIIDEDHQ